MLRTDSHHHSANTILLVKHSSIRIVGFNLHFLYISIFFGSYLKYLSVKNLLTNLIPSDPPIIVEIGWYFAVGGGHNLLAWPLAIQ